MAWGVQKERMGNNFNYLKNTPSLDNVLTMLERKITYNEINCVRVAIVEEFNAENLTVKCKIANKMVLGVDESGIQKTQDYPPIYAKVQFLGWGNIGITYPIQVGTEGILLFSDREIESWFINGGVNPLSYDRCHAMTDAIFICGLRSLPNMIEIAQNCLSLFYLTSNIQIADGTITLNGDTTINGNLVVNGNINATGDIVAGQISLKNHVHGNGNEGQDTTKPK